MSNWRGDLNDNNRTIILDIPAPTSYQDKRERKVELKQLNKSRFGSIPNGILLMPRPEKQKRPKTKSRGSIQNILQRPEY